MPQTKDHLYCKALRQAITAAGTAAPLKDKLEAITRIVSRTFDTGAAISLLDATGSHLIQTAHWRLPPTYVQKGLIDVGKSLNETVSGAPVFIENVAADSRVQYSSAAVKAGIVSIFGAPISQDGHQIGVLRLYFKKTPVITFQDTSFVKALAQLAGIVLSRQTIEVKGEVPAAPAKQAGMVKFNHASEEEFARILDFYNVPWMYEPRSFPIGRKKQGTPELFTPDFYLPSLDLYVELTTMKQSLVTQKNRKLKALKTLYPETKITLLYKNDYEKLLAKYGTGPLAESRAHGVSRILYSAAEIDQRVKDIAARISADYAGRRPVLLGVQRGFLCFMADLIRQITVPMDLDFIAISYYSGAKEPAVKITKEADLPLAGRHILLVEDIVDTGITLNYILNYLQEKQPASLSVCTLLDREARRLVNIKLDYTGFNVPDEFVVGYGLDYHEEYRNLPFIVVPQIKGPEKEKSEALNTKHETKIKEE
ncbi:hypoxanthine phosphoribosyltransferase [Dehalogenimonas formicexedens]|uniref:Hypoxanthine-guanine phosphoribosyltransferase n=1 Tax=Dehalogenimonas formicexedens TaxID=1839801 RepID=A0A1P8F921_9CHLR|nr:hypoxanthine phosphoribosyltransferase [Dehalogenimonas formicexedens]APV44969.1 hypoxanthine phosphoribosyltransferase [Dehalogenimonas formicexedens]